MERLTGVNQSIIRTNDELISVMEASFRFGVKCVKIGDIVLEFESKDSHPSLNIENRPSITSNPEIEESITTSPDISRMYEEDVTDNDFDNLPLEDPSAFEDLLANGKLEDFGEAHAEI